MSRYLLTPRAKRDLDGILSWYERERSPTAARKVNRDIRAQLRKLGKHAERGHPREDLTSSEYLFWTHRELLLVYLPNTNPVQVIAIWHSAQEPSKLEKVGKL